MAESNVPDWLTADFLKASLESDPEHFSDITITNHTFEPVVAAGNNYGSVLLRVKINYKTLKSAEAELSTSLVIKVPLTGGHGEKLNTLFPNFFEKEPKFYREFVKEAHKLTKLDIVAKHYTSPNPLCVVLEDLSASGYKMVDRHKLLDFDHCKLYIEASAKIHALSVAVNKKNPELIKFLTKENPKRKQIEKENFNGMFSLALKSLAVFLEEKPNCEEYIKVLKQVTENDIYWTIYEEAYDESYVCLDTPLEAMMQQDPWSTNMMFKYDASGNVTDIKLIDFQCLRLSTPIREFFTFLWASVNPEVRETRMNDLYHLYCDSLNANLAELGCSETLPFETMKESMRRMGPLSLGLTCVMMALSVTDGVGDMSALYSELASNVPIKESAFYKLYLSTTFNKYAAQIMHQIAREGVFDLMKEKAAAIISKEKYDA